MFFFKIIKSAIIILSCCLLALSAHSFPKKKHSVVKEKLDKENFENIYEYGYYYGFLEYCSYRGTKDKNFQKRIKGLVAYTNWDLFLVFNKGVQRVEGDLHIAGIGWAGQSINGEWQSKPIDWGLDLKGCDDKGSMERAFMAMEEVASEAILQFLLERDNYQSNLNALLIALQQDKKDDYGSVIQKVRSASETYGTSDSTVFSNSSTTEEYSTTNVAIDQNNSNGSSSIKTKLKELKSLFEDELISENDYNAKKQELLDLL